MKGKEYDFESTRKNWTGIENYLTILKFKNITRKYGIYSITFTTLIFGWMYDTSYPHLDLNQAEILGCAKFDEKSIFFLFLVCYDYFVRNIPSSHWVEY